MPRLVNSVPGLVNFVYLVQPAADKEALDELKLMERLHKSPTNASQSI